VLKEPTRIVDPDPSFWMRRLWKLWRHEYEVIESREVIDDVTNRRASPYELSYRSLLEMNP